MFSSVMEACHIISNGLSFQTVAHYELPWFEIVHIYIHFV